MADVIDIDTVILEAAAAALPAGQLRRVETEAFMNSVGEAGLRVTIVLADGDPTAVNGDLVLETMLKVSDALWLAGEFRPPMLVFATEDELIRSGDPDD